MIDLSDVDEKRLNVGMQILRDELKRKGWKVKIPYVGCVHCFVERGGEKKPLHLFSTTPPTTSWASAYMANNKYATYQVLNEYGIKQPETEIVLEKSFEEDLLVAKKLMEKYGEVVVKPIDGGHGKGITVGVCSEKKLKEAIAVGFESTTAVRAVVVQQMLQGEVFDIRVLVVGGEFAAAIWRKPASVMGDGESSIRKLIERENEVMRGEAYFARLARIDIVAAERYMADEIESVPQNGEKVAVLGVANYGQGGELVDATDDIPEWMKTESEKISSIMGLPVCGVDYLLTKKIRMDGSANDLGAYLIEVNKCPSFAMHDRPTEGKSRNAIRKYVDYLDTI